MRLWQNERGSGHHALMDGNRLIFAGTIVAMVLTSIGAVGSGHAWLLFGSVPLALSSAVMLARGKRGRSGTP
jgi:hypothetical protein